VSRVSLCLSPDVVLRRSSTPALLEFRRTPSGDQACRRSSISVGGSDRSPFTKHAEKRALEKIETAPFMQTPGQPLDPSATLPILPLVCRQRAWCAFLCCFFRDTILGVAPLLHTFQPFYLANNAGIIRRQDAFTMTISDWDDAFSMLI